MTMSDPIADMLTRIRNANTAKHDTVDIPNDKIITGLKRISKPGLRVYAKKDEVPKVLDGLGTAILSTNQGVITDKKARELEVGGEVLAFIW